MTTVSSMLQLLGYMVNILLVGRHTPDAEMQHLCELAYDGSGQGWYVGGHHRHGMGFLYGNFEASQIQFPQSTLRQIGGGHIALQFTVVGGKMFHAHALSGMGLYAPDYGCRHLSRYKGVFGIFSFALGP